MSVETRLDLLRQIEERRNRPVLLYATSLRPNAAGQIASDVIPHFARVLDTLPTNTKELDLIVVSNGGDPTVAWRIVSLIRERCEKLSVLIPYAAYSAATLLALGADEIVMHPNANLGPVDPQITKQSPAGNTQSNFAFEDLKHYLDFVRTEVGITDQEQLQKSFELLCSNIAASDIGFAKRSAQLMLSLGEQLLLLHMEDRNEANTIAESFNRNFYHHGYPIGRTEAKKIRLKISDPDEELEKLIWETWKNLEAELDSNTPFDPMGLLYEANPESGVFCPPVQIDIPVNLPNELKQQAYQQALNQISVSQVETLKKKICFATLESAGYLARFETEYLISGMRTPDMNFSVNCTPVSQKWCTVTHSEVES